MKVAIYETVHLECIIPLCNLFSNKKNEVYFLVSTDFEKDLKETLGLRYDNFNWNFIAPDIGWAAHYKKARSFFLLTHFDLILLNTVESRHLLISFALRKTHGRNVILNLHEINNFFQPLYSLHPRKMFRTLAKRSLKRKITAFIVNADEMKSYLKQKGFTQKPVFWLPYIASTIDAPSQQQDNKITIIIPGAIDERRRDYDFALDVLQLLEQKQPGFFHLILAGKPIGNYGDRILNRAGKLIKHGASITYFKTIVEEKRFQELIAASHFVFAPLVINTTIQDGIPETYGLSKFSGNVYDAIRYAIPLIAPANLCVPTYIQNGVLTYTLKEDLVHQLEELVTHKEKLHQYLLAASASSKNFTTEKIITALEAMLIR